MRKFISIFILSSLLLNIVPIHASYGMEKESFKEVIKSKETEKSKCEEISEIDVNEYESKKKSKLISNYYSNGSQLFLLIGGATLLNYMQSPQSFSFGGSLLMSVGGPYLIAGLISDPLKKFFGGITEYYFPTLFYKEHSVLEERYKKIKDKLFSSQQRKIQDKLEGMRSYISDGFEPQIVEGYKKRIRLMLEIYESLQTEMKKIDIETSRSKLEKTLKNYDKDTQKEVLSFVEQIVWSSQHHDFKIGEMNPFAKKCVVWRGGPGTGKTTLAEKIVRDLGLSLQILRLKEKDKGELTGQPEGYESAEMKIGQIARAMINAKMKNPIILIDDAHIAVNNEDSEIGPLLLELLDPNKPTFKDELLGEIDISGVTFILTTNEKFAGKSAKALDSRLETHEFKAFTKDQKNQILKSHYEDYSKECKETLNLSLPAYEKVKDDLGKLIENDKDEQKTEREGVRELIENAFKPYMMKKINEATKKTSESSS